MLCEKKNSYWTIFNQYISTCILYAFENQPASTILVFDNREGKWKSFNAKRWEEIRAIFVGVTILPSDLGRLFPELIVLQANNIEETTIENVIFKDLTKLEVIDLQYKGIRTLEEGVFADQKMLKILFLNHNQLTSIRASILQDLLSIQEIYLHNNPLLQIDPELSIAHKNLKVFTICNLSGRIFGLDNIKCLKDILSNSTQNRLDSTQKELENCVNNSKEFYSQITSINKKINSTMNQMDVMNLTHQSTTCSVDSFSHHGTLVYVVIVLGYLVVETLALIYMLCK